MIRKLKLINAKGETWDLNRESSFFHTLSGFGFEDATQYERIGTTFYPLDEILNQGRVDGSVFFSEPDSYGRYREFARFVRVMPLTLVYQMDDVFRLQVRVAKLEKGEKINGGIGLDCPISFIAEGLFYRTVNKYGNTIMIGGKIYDYGYPHTYADESYNTVLIDSDSNEDSPCRITIFGPCLNPQWKHYVDNQLYETGSYAGDIPVDHKLVIDTTQIPYSITERGAMDELVADRYQMCDFNTERFFHLQKGANRISVIHDGINTLKVLVEGRISYETV